MSKIREGKAKYLVMVSLPGCLPNDTIDCNTVAEAHAVAKQLIDEYREYDAILKESGMSDGENCRIVTPLRDILAKYLLPGLPITYVCIDHEIIEISRLEE